MGGESILTINFSVGAMNYFNSFIKLVASNIIYIKIVDHDVLLYQNDKKVLIKRELFQKIETSSKYHIDLVYVVDDISVFTARKGIESYVLSIKFYEGDKKYKLIIQEFGENGERNTQLNIAAEKYKQEMAPFFPNNSQPIIQLVGLTEWLQLPLASQCNLCYIEEHKCYRAVSNKHSKLLKGDNIITSTASSLTKVANGINFNSNIFEAISEKSQSKFSKFNIDCNIYFDTFIRLNVQYFMNKTYYAEYVTWVPFQAAAELNVNYLSKEITLNSSMPFSPIQKHEIQNMISYDMSNSINQNLIKSEVIAHQEISSLEAMKKAHSANTDIAAVTKQPKKYTAEEVQKELNLAFSLFNAEFLLP